MTGPSVVNAFAGWNLASDNISKPYGRDFNVTESSAMVEDGVPKIRAIDRITRLPLMLTGTGLIGVGLYEVVTGYTQWIINLLRKG